MMAPPESPDHRDIHQLPDHRHQGLAKAVDKNAVKSMVLGLAGDFDDIRSGQEFIIPAFNGPGAFFQVLNTDAAVRGRYPVHLFFNTGIVFISGQWHNDLDLHGSSVAIFKISGMIHSGS